MDINEKQKTKRIMEWFDGMIKKYNLPRRRKTDWRWPQTKTMKNNKFTSSLDREQKKKNNHQ